MTLRTWKVITVSENLTPSLALTVISEIPVESSSSEPTEREWPEMLASTSDSSELLSSSSVSPETGTG